MADAPVSTPVWVWLPGLDSPVRAAELSHGNVPRFVYVPAYLDREDAIALDPIALRLSRKKTGVAVTASDALPGVLRDAKPAGYGADRLDAQAGKQLTPLELLERGVADGVGAVEVCHDIERKLAWRPKTLADLKAATEELAATAPASRAVRRLADDLDTSAGGERPKVTIEHDGRLWLAKMRDRADKDAMPAREFVTMRLAREAGLDVAEVDLKTFGAHQALLVARFDRTGAPRKPQRWLFASAHTAMNLPLGALPGDPARSYLNLGDSLRSWAKGDAELASMLRELWRRMAFNALVGNVDDHPLNHGFLRDQISKTGWRLAPAFDITPALSKAPDPIADGVVLKMSTGSDNLATANKARLLAAAQHFGISVEEADHWLLQAAQVVAHGWRPMLEAAAGPVIESDARMTALLDDAAQAFAYCEWLVQQA